jgi:phosphatidylglycerophosphate synthase
MPDPEAVVRRPIPSPRAHWVTRAACWLEQAGARPNQISLLGLALAIAASTSLVLAGKSEGEVRIALLLVAAALMPLRLLCNVLDGKLAVEFDLKTPSGAIYNELPDRLSDPLLLVSAGYAIGDAAWAPDLGWAAAVVALLTAYVRILGVAAGAGWHFEGPMTKPRRMYVLVVACLFSALEVAGGWPQGRVLTAALVLIIVGGVLTVVRRLRRIVADLEAV